MASIKMVKIHTRAGGMREGHIDEPQGCGVFKQESQQISVGVGVGVSVGVGVGLGVGVGVGVAVGITTISGYQNPAWRS